MTDKLHTLFTVDDGIHIAQAWNLATYAERAGLSAGLSPADVGRIAFVAEDLTFWILADDDGGEGPVWKDITISVFAGSTPLSVGSANSAGTSDAYAREDHVHDASSKADALVTIRAHTGTTDTLVLSDAGKLVTSNNAAAVTQTIPANASVAIPVGGVVQLAQLGAGQVSIAITTDTLRLPTGFVAKCRGQYSTVTLTKIASTTWLASGDLAFV
jgi:hypothetical protein